MLVIVTGSGEIQSRPISKLYLPHKPSLIARLKTASIRRLTRSADSVLSNHMGSSISRTCFLSISETGKCPIMGKAYVFKLLSHCLAVLRLVHSCSFARNQTAFVDSHVQFEGDFGTGSVQLMLYQRRHVIQLFYLF